MGCCVCFRGAGVIAIGEGFPVRQFSSILVYRGESESNATVKIAARVAASSGAHITLGDTSERDAEAGGLKQAALNRIAARMRRSGIKPSTVLLQGEPADAIVECVVRDGHDLLVMNAPAGDRMSGDREMTEQIIKRSPVPVLLARELRRRKVLRILAAVDASEWDTRDASALNERLVKGAVWFAEHLDGSVHVLHVWQPVAEGPMRWTGASDEAMTEYHDTGRDHVVTELEATVRRARVEADHIHVEIGDPRILIPKFAADRGIDLIVIGTFARSGLSGRILGNSANAIVDRSPCSMLIVPRVKSG